MAFTGQSAMLRILTLILSALRFSEVEILAIVEMTIYLMSRFAWRSGRDALSNEGPGRSAIEAAWAPGQMGPILRPDGDAGPSLPDDAWDRCPMADKERRQDKDRS